MRFDTITAKGCNPECPTSSTSTTSSTTTTSTSTLSTSTLTPCQSTALGGVTPDITTGNQICFGSFSPGFYYIQYFSGSLKYALLNGYFQVNNWPNGAGYNIVFSGGVGVIEGPGNSLGYQNVTDLQNANMELAVRFYHTGGSICMFLWDTGYAGHLAGPTGPPQFMLYYDCLNTTTTSTSSSTTTPYTGPSTSSSTTLSTSSTSSSTTSSSSTSTPTTSTPTPIPPLACVNIGTNGLVYEFGSFAPGTYRIVYEAGMVFFYVSVNPDGTTTVQCGLFDIYVTYNNGGSRVLFPSGAGCQFTNANVEEGLMSCLAFVQHQAQVLDMTITQAVTSPITMEWVLNSGTTESGYPTAATFCIFQQTSSSSSSSSH